MSGARTCPVLPCANLDDTLAFYEALGLTVTFRQQRPNPCAVVQLADIAIHLAAIDGFEPASSYGSAIITVPEPEDTYAAFKAGLRDRFGSVPIKGIPPPAPTEAKGGDGDRFHGHRRRGNWLRFYRTGASEDEPEEQRRSGLGRAIEVAARQGDARGDDKQAIAVLDAGLIRFPDAPPREILEALIYRTELKHRTGVDPDDDLAAADLLLGTSDLGEGAAKTLAAARELLGR